MLPGLSCEGLEGQRQASHGVPTGGRVSEPLASTRLQGSWPLYGNSHVGWISNGCPGPRGRAPHALGVPPASWLFLGGTSLSLAAPAHPPRALCPRDSPRPPSVAKLSKLARLLSPRSSRFSCLLFFTAPVPFGAHLHARAPEQALSHVLPRWQDAPAQPPLLPTGTLMSCLPIRRGGLGRGPLPGKDRVSLRVQSQTRVFT